ncbi:MAG: NADH oxidase [Cyanobacteria bacterium PR.3.49]|nr:NADH oxidase [Cyanobacteria bacterium PR.3.49]
MSEPTTKVEITPDELKARRERGDRLIVLDIREPHELKISVLPDVLHIPMGELTDRIEELEGHKNEEIVVVCRAGNRSSVIADFLRESGFARVYNLTGGMNLWADSVDPSFQKY